MLKKEKILKYIILLVIVLNTISTFSIAISEQYIWAGEEDTTNLSKTVQTTAQVEEKNSLKLESGGAILIEQNTGEVLYSYNEHEKLRPASVTKVMTILLIMEAIDNGQLNLTDKIPCSENASSMGGSQIWLDTTETLTVDEMLKAICVVSAND